jgi:hypothetical protein
MVLHQSEGELYIARAAMVISSPSLKLTVACQLDDLNTAVLHRGFQLRMDEFKEVTEKNSP